MADQEDTKVDVAGEEGDKEQGAVEVEEPGDRELGVREGWFLEREVMWPGQVFGLQVAEVLHREQSEHQEILVFQSTSYGRVLALDGVIQLTERDEFAYQEMMVHVPLLSHPDPKHVLIVGGGDGGVLREVARHAGVESITMCEIDRRVVEVARKFFAESTATAFDDARLDLQFLDAAEYIAALPGHFDVVIVDSSDPVGPAESLYTRRFYLSLRAALRQGGLVCTQGECAWLHLHLIGEVMGHCGQLFPTVDYAYTCVPSYPAGQIGLLLCSLDGGEEALAPRRSLEEEVQEELRYYSPAIHRAAFVLPNFAEKVIAPLRRPRKEKL